MDILFWLYLVNAVLLLNHEIDSAYWKEWELFNLPGGITGFLLLHFPLIFIVLYGLVLIDRAAFWGFVCSLFLCCGGIFAFIIHFYFLKQGRREFNQPLSKAILLSTLVASITQLFYTVYILRAYDWGRLFS